MKPQSASDDISRLREHLEGLLRVWDAAFSRPIRHDDTNIAFMALAFASRQGEHARNVLRLQRAVDTVLITRSMFEGLCQLLWAAQAPDDRSFSSARRRRRGAGTASRAGVRSGARGNTRHRGPVLQQLPRARSTAEAHSTLYVRQSTALVSSARRRESRSSSRQLVILKLRRPFNDPVFTITPWLVFICGHAARVRWN